MIGPDDSVIPSLMFHSVGREDSAWFWARELSEPLSLFEDRLELLGRKGFKTVFWDDVFAHMAGSRQLSGRSVMLTFDDGYLDNWVFVFPLLKRYGMRATIFVTTDFIEPDGPPRPTLENVWNGSLRADQLHAAGFLRPSEIRSMVQSGLVDIQSHASTHTWYFAANRAVDFYHPRVYAKYPWMAWNVRPQRKPFYMTEDQAGFVDPGEVIFAHRKAIVARRFTPDPGALAEYREQLSKLSPAARKDPATLAAHAAAIGKKLHSSDCWPGTMESEADRETRIEQELLLSRATLERLGAKRVEFICWPGGAYDDDAIRIALRCGFRAYTLGSRDQISKRNRPGATPQSLKRLSAGTHIITRGIDCGIAPAWYHYIRMRGHQSSVAYEWLKRACKLTFLSRALVARTVR